MVYRKHFKSAVVPADFALVRREVGVEQYLEEHVLLGEQSVFTVIAFDPGATTGWAVVCVYPECLEDPEMRILENIIDWRAGEFSGREDEIADQMLALVGAWDDDAHVVVEDFVLRQMSMARELLSPVRITARFEQMLRDTGYGRNRGAGPGRTVTLQAGAMAMSVITDERLRAARMYDRVRGLPHGRDALRHALTWLRRLKANNAREAARTG